MYALNSIKKYVCKVLDPHSIVTVTSPSSFAHTHTHKLNLRVKI